MAVVELGDTSPPFPASLCPVTPVTPAINGSDEPGEGGACLTNVRV